jgi:hypothetical protein
LDEAADGQVTLVSAPAGYGKTLLLAEWAARRPELTAWVSLDDDDDNNNDRRFWAAVLAALGTCAAVPADNALHDLALPGLPSRDPSCLLALLECVTKRTRDQITPGTSALFVLTSDAVVDKVQEAFAGQRAELLFTNLSKDQEDTLREAFAE